MAKKPQVWLYYYRYMSQYCQPYASVDEAMDAAESMEDHSEASTIAIEDEVTGQVYDKQTMQARWEAKLRQHMAEEAAKGPQEEKPSPPEQYRTFQGEQWKLDWMALLDDEDEQKAEEKPSAVGEQLPAWAVPLLATAHERLTDIAMNALEYGWDSNAIETSIADALGDLIHEVIVAKESEG